MASKLMEEFLTFYDEIKKHQRVEELISWELHTEAPEKGVENLVELQAFFGTKAFEMLISEKMNKYLTNLLKEEEFNELEEHWKISLKKLKKDYDNNKNIPVDFYTDYKKTIANSEDVWKKSKQNNDYNMFKPYLEKIINMTKEMCKYKDSNKHPYDLLLDEYEKSMERDQIDEIFDEIKKEVIPLIKDISSKKQSTSDKFLGKFDINKQKELSKFLLEYIGFKIEAGVMSESEHPFTTSLSPSDVRLTNHYDENNIINPIFSIIHEGGHGIFEQNVDIKYSETPISNCEYMGLHESQSRFYENILGRNINFWKPIYYKLKELFPEYQEIKLEEFYKEINRVENGLIRIDSDEVTYCLHIIIRYEIEKELFEEKIKVEDLREVWNEKVKEYLGVDVESDAKGILQDSHWSGGSFGYFPSYLLGSVYDGMLYEKIEEELGSIDEILSNGNINDITKWLNENIHKNATTIVPKELIEELCGKKISAKPLINYFKKKYSKIYNL